MTEYSKISLRTLTIALSPTRGFPCAPRLSGTSRHIGRRSVTNSITKKSEMGQKKDRPALPAAALIIESGHRPLHLKADIASLPRACPFSAIAHDMHYNERSQLIST